MRAAAAIGPIRAAQYVRMSTEHQCYSLEGQAAANAAYAERQDMRWSAPIAMRG